MLVPFVDNYYLLLVVPAIAFSGLIQMRMSSTLKKYSGVANKKGLTGRDVAAQMLKLNNIDDVPIKPVAGTWSDHYGRGRSQDGKELKWISLSEPVFNKTSISAVAVAAHEAGHAIQYASKYKLMGLRNFIRPLSNFGSKYGPYLAMGGIIFGFGPLLDIGILLFSGAVLFSLLTLPAELNASSRALIILRNNNMLTKEELSGAKKALNAAAMTYFASLLTNCASFLRLLLLRNRRRR
ncbi:MAG: zinc metallopeptidase [Spirochaetaceae bacterium]|nr:zinc metallopeptidase [Spirochaetaceae bacterium]